MAQPDSCGNENHVCYYVVKSQCNEGQGRKPYCYDFGHNFSCRGGEEDSEADQPVCAYGSEKDLMPARISSFRRCKTDHRFPILARLEYSTPSKDERNKECASGEVSKEADDPDLGYLVQGDSTFQKCNSHEHDVTSKKIGTAQHDHDETDWEECRSNCSNQAWCICLKPRRCFSGQSDSTAKAEKGASHEAVEEELVITSVGLFCSDSADQLSGLLWSKGVHTEKRGGCNDIHLIALRRLESALDPSIGANGCKSIGIA